MDEAYAANGQLMRCFCLRRLLPVGPELTSFRVPRSEPGSFADSARPEPGKRPSSSNLVAADSLVAAVAVGI